MSQKGVLTQSLAWCCSDEPILSRWVAAGTLQETEPGYDVRLTFLIWLALPSCCKIPHGYTLTLVPWWIASPVSKVGVTRRLAGRYSSHHLLVGVFEPWWWQRLFHGACCWEHPGGHTSHGSGKVLHSRRSSRGLGDLSLLLETLFWLSSMAVTRETLVLVWWWSAMG